MVARTGFLRILVLVAVMGVLLAACGGSPTADDPTDSEASGQPDPTDSESPSENPEEALAAAAQEEGTLVWYAALSPEDADKIANEFKAAYPDIEVEVVASETAAVAERVLSELRAGQANADVFMSSGQYSLQLADEGATQAYPDMPHIDALPAGILDDEARYFPFIQITNTIAYNTELVSEDEAPKSWDDLLDPKWQGKITMQAPRGGGAFSWFVWMRDNHTGGDEEAWTSWMEDLVAQDLLLADYFQAQEFLSSGEASIHAVAYPSFVEALKADGAPVDWVAVNPMPTNPQHLAVYVDAPHPNAAKLFISWILSQDGQSFLSAEMGNTIVRSDVDDPAGARLEGVEFIEKDTEDIAANEEAYLEKAREIFDLP